MKSRAHGRGTSKPWLYPPGFGWQSYCEFRAWAIAHGFSKTNDSPDRIDPRKPYGPDNVRWVTKGQNYGAARGRAYYAMQEPQYDDAVPF